MVQLVIRLRWLLPWALAALALAGCAHIGRLADVGNTVAPMKTESTAENPTVSNDIQMLFELAYRF